MKIQNGASKKAESEEERTDWGSIWIGSVICFLTATQFSIYFSSLWPYLLQLDHSATENFFGLIAAVYSLGQAISSPVFGFWSNKIKQTKFPTIVGISLAAIGNILYIMLPLNIVTPKYMMMISRAVMGTGGGIIALLRTSSVTASTPKDRARAISLNTGAFSLGLTLGPALQIFFTPLSYPGIHLIGNIRLNLYTGPAISGLVANAFCLALLHFKYRDSTVGLHKVAKMENEAHERFFALPKFDWIAAAVCIFTRFAQMFVVTNLETIGSPLSMTMFAWDRETSVFYNSLMHGAFSIVGFIIYAANTIFNFGPKMNHRLSCIIGLLIIVAFHLLTYPWPFLSGKIKYQEETWINGTEPVGCRPSFDWCATTPPINVYVYMISYSLMVSTAFALISVSMNTVYSVIIGPRNQNQLTLLALLAIAFTAYSLTPCEDFCQGTVLGTSTYCWCNSNFRLFNLTCYQKCINNCKAKARYQDCIPTNGVTNQNLWQCCMKKVDWITNLYCDPECWSTALPT